MYVTRLRMVPQYTCMNKTLRAVDCRSYSEYLLERKSKVKRVGIRDQDQGVKVKTFRVQDFKRNSRFLGILLSQIAITASVLALSDVVVDVVTTAGVFF